MTMLEVISGRDLRDWMQGAGSLAPLDYRHIGLAGKKLLIGQSLYVELDLYQFHSGLFESIISHQGDHICH